MAKIPAYFDTAHIDFSSIIYEQEIAEIDGQAVTHDEERLDELPTKAIRAKIREHEVQAFLRWIQQAPKNAEILYHVGELDRDRVTDPTANLLGHLVLRAEGLGFIAPFMRPAGLFVREYYAQRTALPWAGEGWGQLLRMSKAPAPPALIPPPAPPPPKKGKK